MSHQRNNTFFFFFYKLALVLSLVLMMSMAAESRIIGIGFGNNKKDAAGLVCNTIYGHKKDETCSSVAAEFNLSLDQFLAINPNINCDSIFVGQWLCVDAST